VLLPWSVVMVVMAMTVLIMRKYTYDIIGTDKTPIKTVNLALDRSIRLY
jgi:hypothetical protein